MDSSPTLSDGLLLDSSPGGSRSSIQFATPSRSTHTSPRASFQGHFRQRSATRASPINLPVRSEGEDVPEIPRRSPRRMSASPGRSYDEAFPTENMGPVPNLGPPTNSGYDPGLIFDDGDERLPPPAASPTIRPRTDADIAAISSPTFSPGAAIDLAEDAFGEELDMEFLSNENVIMPQHMLYGTTSPSILPSDSVSVAGLARDTSPTVYYPTRIPSKLFRPPTLSNRPRHRKSSLPLEDLPPAPHWEPSPLEEEVTFVDRSRSLDPSIFGLDLDMREGRDEDGDEGGSDVDSDRATIMSDDRDEFETSLAAPFDENDEKGAGAKKSGWMSKLFRKKGSKLGEKKDEMGEKYDAKEAKTLEDQMATLDAEAAFSRLDPETIQRHSQMFNAGGIHNSIAPHTGGPTSLIEELEIRKAGKAVQRKVFLREVSEMERQRAEDAASQKVFHPADLVHNLQPTLMQMQHMAAVDYEARVNWHKRAVNRHYIQENGDETLAQRRARLKAEKTGGSTGPSEPGQHETLAERRQRLRRQRELAAIKHVSSDSVAFTESGSLLAHEEELAECASVNSSLATAAY